MNKVQPYIAWIIVVSVSVISFVAWASAYQWRLGSLSVYQIFPLFGLLAYSMIWSQYITYGLSKWLKAVQIPAKFYPYTGYIFLLFIFLHPGLLVYKRFRDGFGLPPHSYMSYVAPGLGWVTLLGSASFLLFIAFEFRRWFGNRRWWHYVADASDLAVLAIAYHALRLGTTLKVDWFRAVWFFYLACLVIVIGQKYTFRLQERLQSKRGATVTIHK